MPSPFPGMDPYLDDAALWPTFHHQLVECLYQILLPGLVDRYRARVAQRRYLAEPTPDSAAAERQEDFVEIRQRNDGRLVTQLEIVSPANKTTAPGRRLPRSAKPPRPPAPTSSRSTWCCKASRPWSIRATACPTGTTPSPSPAPGQVRALRDLHGHVAEAVAALPPAAGRRRPRHRRRSLHRLHALLRPGRLRGQDRLQADPFTCTSRTKTAAGSTTFSSSKSCGRGPPRRRNRAGGLLPLGTGRTAQRRDQEHWRRRGSSGAGSDRRLPLLSFSFLQ